VDLIGAALKLRRDASALANQALALADLGRKHEALANLDAAIALNPDFVEAWNNRGNLLRELRRYPEALASLDRVVALRPGYRDAHGNRGNVLVAMKRPEEALAAFDRAVGPDAPASAEILNGRGVALRTLDRLDEALVHFDRAVALKPDYVDPLVNRAGVLEALRRTDEALRDYAAALARDPHHALARWNRSVILLRRGDFANGLADYEWRFGPEEHAHLRRDFAEARWNGMESLDGRTILLHAEQGLGDTLQFCRYAPMAKTKGARVILEAAPVLLPILRSLRGVDTFVAAGDPLPAFDLHCPLMSLPFAFGTRPATIPADVPYLFADAGRSRVWTERLGPARGRRIGLVWSGSATHTSDRRRSLPLADLLTALPSGVELHSLQKDVRPADQATLAARHDIADHAAALTDFGETAALVSLMDLVISVDTSVAHLAGAMGKTTWMLLAHVADWRWLEACTDTPWYPTLRLVRQTTPGDWTPVLGAVHQALPTEP
jgi:tetratricopeptide (TPR) repeat protein